MANWRLCNRHNKVFNSFHVWGWNLTAAVQAALVEEHLTNPKGLHKQNHRPPKTLPCRFLGLRSVNMRAKRALNTCRVCVIVDLYHCATATAGLICWFNIQIQSNVISQLCMYSSCVRSILCQTARLHDVYPNSSTCQIRCDATHPILALFKL